VAPVGDPLLDAPASMAFGPTAIVTPANVVTVARLVAAPVLFALIIVNGPSWTNVALWGVLALTDGVDGWVARRHGTTRSGAFLDPLADKVLVLGAMIALTVGGELWWLPVAVIVARELWMSFFRFRAARAGRSVPARRTAKVKTWAQDMAVGLALIPSLAFSHPGVLSAVLWLAVTLTVVTGLEYLFADARPRDHDAAPVRG
jgi:CDP-diacylglycerol---glycerol-3-phosphate 3-phosphatidyltransferase